MDQLARKKKKRRKKRKECGCELKQFPLY